MTPESMKELGQLLDALVEAPDDMPFTEMAKLGGLDPAKDFRHANLKGVDFAGCDLDGWDFTGADLRGAILADCSFKGAIGLDQAQTDPGVVFPMERG